MIIHHSPAVLARLTWIVVTAAALTAAAVPAAAAPSSLYCIGDLSADESLPTGGPELNWNAPRVFGVTTDQPYWSVVATHGSQGYNSDLGFYRPPARWCHPLATSAEDYANTDWVAIDNNPGRYPTGSYLARVVGAGEVPKYLVQFVAGHDSLATGEPTTEQPVGLSTGPWNPGVNDWIVDIRDVWLNLGGTYTFTVTGGLDAMYLLRSDQSDTTTWTRNRTSAEAVLQVPPSASDMPDQPRQGSLTVHPTQSGWYGALFVRNGWWGPPVTVRVAAS